MSKIFYVSEVVKFAIEKEKESYFLYKQLSEKVTDKNLKDIFRKLMEQEKYHEAFYEKMLNSIREEQSTGVSEDDEYVAYMKELIEESRSTLPVSALDLTDLKAVLDYAIAREKDSVLFYTGLKNLVKNSMHEHIDLIIREEVKHMAILTGLKKNLLR